MPRAGAMGKGCFMRDAKNVARGLACALALAAPAALAQTPEEVLRIVEPGVGYSRLKQWAADNRLVFESFTRDQLTLRDGGLRQGFGLRIFARFCGEDFAGRAASVTIQQIYANPAEALVALRDAAELLGGAAVEGRLPGAYALRRDRGDAGKGGLAVGQDGGSDKGSWEAGLFVNAAGFMLQILRRREAACG